MTRIEDASMSNKSAMFPALRVLVVDDEPSMRDVIGRGLLAQGFQVQLAEGGDQALELARKETPDVVICDLAMPGMDGIEVLNRLKEQQPSIEVIILTAQGTVQTAVRALKQGAFDYLVKPVDLRELSTLICRARARGRIRAYSAEEYTKIKNEFVSTVSHELRTPLVSVIGHISLLLKGIYGAPSGGQRQALERAESGALRLLDLVKKIVDFSHLEAGEMVLCTAPFELDEVVSKLVTFLRPAAAAKALALAVEVPPHYFIKGDSGKLEQLLGCLVGNAIKFTDHGGIAIKVVETDGGAWFELSVTDTGIGFDPEDAPIIFREFQQLDGSSTRRYNGAGLGLALCKQLVALMGGAVRVHSSLGEGSCFTVRLPTGRSSLHALGAQAA